MNTEYSLVKAKNNRLQLVMCTVLTVITCLFLLTWPRNSQACSCMIPDLERQIETSGAIFTGSVSAADRLNAGPLSQPDSVRVVFTLDRVYKGDLPGTAVVYTAVNAAACGVNFLVGERYLVFAYEREGTLRTGLCNLTQPVEQAPDLLLQLGLRTDLSPPIRQRMLRTEMGSLAPGDLVPRHQQDGIYLRSWRLRWGRIYSHARFRGNS